MRLVVAIIVLRTDIDESDGKGALGKGARGEEAGRRAGEGSGSRSLKKNAAVHGKEFDHWNAPLYGGSAG